MRNTFVKNVMAMSLGMAIALPLMAKDVHIEQYNVTAARKTYENTKSEYASLTQSIKEQEKRIAQENARLKELKARQLDAKNRLSKAKSHLDHEEKALDQAWNSGGR